MEGDFYVFSVHATFPVNIIVSNLGVIMYKSIMLSNREHTREVICSAMLKHGLEGSPEDFNLAQMLPDKGTPARQMYTWERILKTIKQQNN